MKKDKKVMVSFTISPSNKKYVEEHAKAEGRTRSSFLDRLITSAIQELEAKN